MFDFVFWLNNLSAHQAPLIAALSRDLKLRVMVIATYPASTERTELGWDAVSHGDASVIIASSEDARRKVESQVSHARVHVFSGAGAYPQVEASRRRVSRLNSSYCQLLMTEPWDSQGLVGKLRLARAWVRGQRALRHADVVLSMGKQSRQQLIRFGVRESAIVPFAYSVDVGSHENDEPAVRRPEDPTSFIFVGSLSELKRPLMLLRALASLSELPWTVTVVGDGPLREALHSEVERSRIGSRVKFTGLLKGRDALMEIRAHDVLVLPSRYDGWGAVVSEALLLGTRVVVSDGAGSSELVTTRQQGHVFRSSSFQELSDALRSEVARGPQLDSDRESLRRWAVETISPGALARQIVTAARDKDAARLSWLSGE